MPWQAHHIPEPRGPRTPAQPTAARLAASPGVSFHPGPKVLFLHPGAKVSAAASVSLPHRAVMGLERTGRMSHLVWRCWEAI